MFAELFGREDGYSRGRGGSMHINDVSIGMLGANGIVGAGMPIAVGAAFANVYRSSDQVAVTFFGDGASNIGAFHEAANLAAVLRLPVLFVCENNGYAEYSPQSRHMVPGDIAVRAAGYGMASEICDGMDVLAVRAAALGAVERARGGGGPTLIEAKTYRFYDHEGISGLRIAYRTEEEVEQWRARDPLDTFKRSTAGILDPAELTALHDRTQVEIDAAIAFAEASPEPKADGLLDNVYSEVAR
jgi:acetoin:2,6-dichlorophenolindophenol oxidoreductase subunit alpha